MMVNGGVDSVFSGHTHFESIPPPNETVNQVVMTAINYQNKWKSEWSGLDYGPFNPSYYTAHVNQTDLIFKKVEL